MNLTIKEYPKELTEKEFYSFMGKFFAERKYRKEMPYLVNDEKYTWKLYFNNQEELIAFYHYHKKNKDTIELGGLYVIQEYRNKKIASFIMDSQDIEFNEFNKISVSNNPIIIHLRKKLGFKETGKRGSYIILTKKIE